MTVESISRRLLLGGATALLLGSCDAEPAGSPTSSATSSPPDGPEELPGTSSPPDGPEELSEDERLVVQVVRSTRELAGAYAALVARHPSLRAATRPLRGHLQEHLTAFGGASEPKPVPRASPDIGRALGRLLAAERAASGARARDAVAAASGDLARTLAAVAASHAQHVAVLERTVLPAASPAGTRSR